MSILLSSGPVGALVIILGQCLVCLFLGVIFSFIATSFGFTGVRMIFSFRSSTSVCTFFGLLLLIFLFNTSASIAHSLTTRYFVPVLFSLLFISLVPLLFGFLKGFDLNPWTLLGMSEMPTEVILPERWERKDPVIPPPEVRVIGEKDPDGDFGLPDLPKNDRE